MSNPFTSIPVRSNADTAKVDAGWWNTIRSALISAFGSGGIAQTQFTIADNQSSYQNITGLLLDETLARAVDIDFTIYRTNGSSVERRERGVLHCVYKPIALAWTFERRTHAGDDALNVADSLNVTSAGQVQYKSDSIGATYVGKMRYQVAIAFDKET